MISPVTSLGMNSTRVIYVENDSALRQFLQESLSRISDLEVIGAYSDGISALNRAVAKKADVALIDFGLDTDGLNGIELGIALRCGQITDHTIRIFAGCGIVAGSNPEKELEESNAKMVAMRSALQADLT
jgi:CheY-like chemotaxis protein